MITWHSTNMLKLISSSPVFLHSLPTSFKNNVLRIDHSSYHPKTTLEFFFITFRLEKVTRLGLWNAYHANIFRFIRTSNQVTLRKYHKNDNKHKKRALVLRAKTGGNKYVCAVQAHANDYSQQTKILITHKQQNAPLLVPFPLSPNQTWPVD